MRPLPKRSPREGQNKRSCMRCPSCGFDNPEGMNFCGKCASPLSPRCPQCGFENPAGFAFCGKCAAPLRAPTVPGAVWQRDELSLCGASTGLDDEPQSRLPLHTDCPGLCVAQRLDSSALDLHASVEPRATLPRHDAVSVNPLCPVYSADLGVPLWLSPTRYGPCYASILGIWIY